MKFHGIDLHTDSLLDTHVTREELNNFKASKYYLSGKSFEKFKSTLSKEDFVVIESCSNAFWLYDQIKGLVRKCYILNTIKFSSNLNKTDKIDGKKLVRKLSYYILHNATEDDFPTIFVPIKEIRDLRGLFSTHKLLKKQINQTKNRIFSILRANGINIKRELSYSDDFILSDEYKILSGSDQFQIILLHKQLRHFEEQKESIESKIKESGYSIFKDEIKLLIGIRGISILTAIAIMSDVIDIRRFPSVRKFCAYLRTTPRVKGSNKKSKVKNTNKQSRTITCSFLSQSVIHFRNAGGYFNNFYNRVKIGKKSGVYRMALMRKILVSVYFMLKRKRHFHWIENDLYQKKINELKKNFSEVKVLKFDSLLENIKFLT